MSFVQLICFFRRHPWSRNKSKCRGFLTAEHDKNPRIFPSTVNYDCELWFNLEEFFRLVLLESRSLKMVAHRWAVWLCEWCFVGPIFFLLLLKLGSLKLFVYVATIHVYLKHDRWSLHCFNVCLTCSPSFSWYPTNQSIYSKLFSE